MPVKLGFQNFYLYSAIEASTGEHFTLELPWVNTDCFQAFLEAFSNAYPDDEIVLIVDGAPWHRSRDLCLPPPMELAYLPPYSPELNPVERLWEHIKRHTIRNKVYGALVSLKDAVAQFLNALKSETIKSLCTAKYLYN